MSDYSRFTSFLENLSGPRVYSEPGPQSDDGGESVDVTYFVGANHLVLRYRFSLEGDLQGVEEV